jgi:hypothetical protein
MQAPLRCLVDDENAALPPDKRLTTDSALITTLCQCLKELPLTYRILDAKYEKATKSTGVVQGVGAR